MGAPSQPRGPVASLVDRHSERLALDRLVDSVRSGSGRVLVVHGEAGVGKTALLEYLWAKAVPDCRVARVAGVQSEMELAFAGLHQVCAPMLGSLEHLPAPQGDALRTAFGLSTGSPPDRFLVGLAVLGLLSEAAATRPVVCLVDDMQWVDRASAQILGFVARRLKAEPIALAFATRFPGGELAGLPELAVSGLREADARTLLDSVLPRGLDAQVREQIIAETQGNPLALLELLRELSSPELAGGFGLPSAVPVQGRLEDNFRRQLDALPDQTRRLMQLAASDPTGDPLLVQRAADQLEIPAQAAVPAMEAGLVEFGVRVRFRHPLVRSAAYRSAPHPERRELHRALMYATNPVSDPDRRAWHAAAASAGPDEQVAVQLERSADRAQARGGLAAAAAFLERAALLTANPAIRAERMLAAAQANLQAGEFAKTTELLANAEAEQLSEFVSARVDLLRGQVAFASGPDGDAPTLLVKAARRLKPLDPDLARETCLDAWIAAMYAGHLARGSDLAEVSRTAMSMAPHEHGPRPVDLLLNGFALLVAAGPAAAAPTLRQARSAFGSPTMPPEEVLRWGWMIPAVDYALWEDDESWAQTARHVQLAREAGALTRLPILLQVMAFNAIWSGEFLAALSVIAQADSATEATGTRIAPYPALTLASFRGREPEAAQLIRTVIEDATAEGQGIAVTWAHWAAAILHNGLGRHDEALAAASQASVPEHVFISSWALPELIEAAARAGNATTATDALGRLAARTGAGGSEYGLGIEARCRALLREGQAAEECYREAIQRLGGTRRRPELARAHLLYGEWLRRGRRRGEAREQLRVACAMLDDIGMEAFAERARRELRATGETVPKRPAQAGSGSGADGGADAGRLTPQEAQVARLAKDGLSNPEIAARLFISARTVQYHLSKVFTKLGVKSRIQLHRTLPDEPVLLQED